MHAATQRIFLGIGLIVLPMISHQTALAQGADPLPVADQVPEELSRDLLTIFVYPPTVTLDYGSPASLMWSMASNELVGLLSFRRRIRFHDERGRELSMKIPYRSIIGHTIACISCTLPDGSSFRHWASMSSYDYTGQALHMFLYEKRGLAMLFHDYPDGRILRGQENVLRLVNYRGGRFRHGPSKGKRKEPRYISFGLDREQCSTVRDFILFFENLQHSATSPEGVFDPSRPEDLLYFSSTIDPYESYQRRLATGKGKVGGGCAPFAVSLLKVAGHFHPDWDSLWARPFQVSESLIGGFEYKVSPFAVMFGRQGKRWVEKGHTVHRLNVYDPHLIWDFIGARSEAASIQLGSGSPGATMVPSQTDSHTRHFQPGPVVELRSPERELVRGKRSRLLGNERITVQGIRLKEGPANFKTDIP